MITKLSLTLPVSTSKVCCSILQLFLPDQNMTYLPHFTSNHIIIKNASRMLIKLSNVYLAKRLPWLWIFNYFRNWFDKVKLCSIDVGRHLCSGLSFNPTNWRQLCTVSSDVLTLWNIGQLNTKYSLVSRFLHFQSFYYVNEPFGLFLLGFYPGFNTWDPF